MLPIDLRMGYGRPTPRKTWDVEPEPPWPMPTVPTRTPREARDLARVAWSEAIDAYPEVARVLQWL